MSKTVILNNDTYLDSSSIMHNKEPLNDIFYKNVYSFDEVVIGRWANGKKIYRKVMNIVIPTVGNSIPIDFQCEWLIDFKVTVFLGNNNGHFVFNGYDNLLSMSPNYINKTIYMDVISDALRGHECSLIFEYTKTPAQEEKLK